MYHWLSQQTTDAAVDRIASNGYDVSGAVYSGDIPVGPAARASSSSS